MTEARPTRRDVDYLIIGGGFYGCCLALFLRSVSPSITVLEAGPRLLDRASRVNQARVHTGFHYPRSVLTAVKSMLLHQRFAEDFPEAVKTDFRMLYAIARRGSKVSAGRFHRMFSDMGAPIRRASPSQAALFDPATIEASFDCTEFAFDHSVLNRHLGARLDALGIDVRTGAEVVGLAEDEGGVTVQVAGGEEIRARRVFNVTYSHINQVLRLAGLPEARLKHELTEIALVRPPAQLDGLAVTVMDGPFFSIMPYPSEGLYSLTHVRYTPHFSWLDDRLRTAPYEIAARHSPESRVRHMIMDSRRYVPCMTETEISGSLFEVKTVLVKNEHDDGRPILFQRQPRGSRIISVMGGKIDNIYDLFELVRGTAPEWAAADARHVVGRAAGAAA
ncbi:MAG: glycine/D-amino acid oxidase-like deaminating enzyme [Planctomycetota bacterium]|jgi:glycine/D-amino acid oxidase-like deaminating enzyme